jgi:hypothetical protein
MSNIESVRYLDVDDGEDEVRGARPAGFWLRITLLGESCSTHQLEFGWHSDPDSSSGYILIYGIERFTFCLQAPP